MLAAIEQAQLVRNWLMCNTIRLVPADDLRWMSALLGPMIRRRFAPYASSIPKLAGGPSRDVYDQ